MDNNTRAVLDRLFKTKNKLEKSMVSYSFLSSFGKCPAMGLNQTFTQSDATLFGGIIHDALEYFLLNPDVTGEQLTNMCLKAIKEGVKKDKKVEKIKFAETYMARTEDIFEDMSFIDRQFKGFDVFSTESKNLPSPYALNMFGKNYFQVPMPFRSKLLLIGSIDALRLNKDKTLAIIQDWKTGKSKLPDELQVSIYAYAVFRMFDTVEKINAFYEYVEYQDNKLVVFVRNADDKAKYDGKKYNGERIIVYSYDDAAEKVTKAVQYYLTGASDPTPSESACKWCEFRDKCPMVYK